MNPGLGRGSQSLPEDIAHQKGAEHRGGLAQLTDNIRRGVVSQTNPISTDIVPLWGTPSRSLCLCDQLSNFVDSS